MFGRVWEIRIRKSPTISPYTSGVKEKIELLLPVFKVMVLHQLKLCFSDPQHLRGRDLHCTQHRGSLECVVVVDPLLEDVHKS